MIILSAALSEACNLNCVYCNVDKQSKKRIDGELFVQEYYRLREANPDEVVKIDFYGGEPLMQYDTIEYVLEKLHQEPNIRFFMPTNGLLLTKEKIDYLQARGVEISLSFDGLWQDKNRLQPNNKGTLKRYLDKAPLFQTIKDYHIHTMIDRGCYNLLENHLFILNNMGTNPMLTIVRDVGTWSKTSVERLNTGIAELFDWYKNNADAYDMPNFIKFYLRHVILWKMKQYEVSSCGAGETHFSFSENKLVPCNRFKDSPEMIEAIPSFVNMRECQTCEVRHYCKKGCLHEQMINEGPIQELCTVYKFIYAEIFKMMNALKTHPKFVAIVKEEIANER